MTSHSDHPFAASTAAAPPLRIWGSRLPADHQQQLIDQVHLRSNQPGQRWRIVAAPPADACIVGGAIAPSLLPSTAVVPLRVWLFDLAPDGGEATRMVRLADRALPRSVPQALSCIETLLSMRTVAATVDTAAATAPLAQPSREALRDLVWHRFKLSRWPSASLMARHSLGYRLAPFLASSHLSLQNLVTLSGASPSGCLAFLRDLLVHHHLRVDLYAERWPLSAQLPTLSVKVSELSASQGRTPAQPARGLTFGGSFGASSVGAAQTAFAATGSSSSATTPPPNTTHRLGLLTRLRQQLGLVHDKH